MRNPDNLREINRTIVAIVILSADDKLLMGRKDPAKGGVYPDAWHIPGGGVEAGETLEQAMLREANQEVLGLDLTADQLKHLEYIGHGESPRTMENGERVWCNMEFNHFEARLNKPAKDYQLKPGDDLVELSWFSREELEKVQQIPGGKEFFQAVGYL